MSSEINQFFFSIFSLIRVNEGNYSNKVCKVKGIKQLETVQYNIASV